MNVVTQFPYLEYIRGGLKHGLIWVHLYKNLVLPDPVPTLQSFEECAWPGYTPDVLCPFGDQESERLFPGHVSTEIAAWEWRGNSEIECPVVGCYLVFDVGGQQNLLAWQAFQKPRLMKQGAKPFGVAFYFSSHIMRRA